MKIYLNNCCYNRILDDRSNSQIYYERNSVMLILELVEKAAVELVGSANKIKIFTKIMNPNQWLSEVLY